MKSRGAPLLALWVATLGVLPFAAAVETSALPDPLLAANGERISIAAQWESVRRPEVLELFRAHVYGRNPVERPENMRFEILTSGEAFEGRAVRQEVRITCPGPHGELSFVLTVYLPNQPERPKGCYLLIVNRNRVIIAKSHNKPRTFWPVDEIIARGYATAAFHNSDIAPDKKEDGFRSGVFGVFDPPRPAGAERPGDAWGTIAAWAWGASRALDYLVTEPRLQGVPLAVVGHSRGGKTALWCGAQDGRVALAISNNSGTTGAAITRGNTVETVTQINTRFPHWFARNYHRYNDAENALPMDQHMLLALMAPRLVYVASASGDVAADMRAEFRACVEAAPVYQLFQQEGVGSEVPPPTAAPLHEGAIGYHLREGKHNLLPEDWDYFMDFTDRHWASRAKPAEVSN